MIHPDASLIMQIQLALIGIILVVGLFFIWRFLQKIYDIILINKEGNNKQINNYDGNNDDIDDDNIAEELMNEVFNNNSKDADKAYMMFKIPSMLSPEVDKSSVTIQEINSIPQYDFPLKTFINSTPVQSMKEEVIKNHVQDDDQDIEEPEQNDEDEKDAESVSINPLSESKLKKMNLTELKKICEDRHLSTEGIKKDLVERILGISR